MVFNFCGLKFEKCTVVDNDMVMRMKLKFCNLFSLSGSCHVLTRNNRKAGVFYNVKTGSSFITSKSSSENLSNQNKHFWWYYKIVNFGILIHVLSWRQQKHKCLLWLLRFSDEPFDAINEQGRHRRAGRAQAR